MAYHQMAYYYDLLMEDAPYDKWALFTEQMIQQTGTTIASIIDLGCGTGQITARLARAGYRMIGVDDSSDMLSMAEQRASAENTPVQWVQQDLRTLTGIKNQDMAISYCDVLNYITEPETLRTVFANVASALKPGGLFIFDVHSLYHVENNLTGQTFAEVGDPVSYVWFCLEGETSGDMHHDLTFFVKNDDHYSRFDEWHHQRTFSVDFYKRLLHDAGFDMKDVSGDFSLGERPIDEQAERIFITAVKRSD
ncbi:class I SAM-dependent DNA methyltransferase [Lentibacillus salicampi]|nr:class I SAM-dependent methyltransferase [Lentibacillus salicampi]